MLTEPLYQTKSTQISQNQKNDDFVLFVDNEEINLKFCELISLKKKIKNIDILELLDANSPDVEIIHLPISNRFLVLSTLQVLEFRELLNGTFDILALNSSIHRILRKGIFNF